jgi:hypothetical protein
LDEGKLPQAWKDVDIKLLHKGGNKTDYNNYRGISLLSHASKIFERMILERITDHVMKKEGCIPDTQFGFLKDKGTADAIFMSRGLAAHTLKLEGGQLFRCFIDLKKAYDMVDRKVLWDLLKLYGLPEKIVRIIRAFHDGALATVHVGDEKSATFELLNGLKQGSVLSPMLFNIFFGAIMHAARKEFDANKLGVETVVKMRGRILTPRAIAVTNFHKRSKVVSDIGFADDCVLCASSAEDLQRMVNILHRIARAFGQTISITKTKIMVVQSERTAAGNTQTPIISIEGQELEVVSKFKYLGSVESSQGKMDDEVLRRCHGMYGAFYKLKHIFIDKKLQLKTRLKLLNIIIVPHGLYGCQAWNLSVKNMAALESVYFAILRRILGVRDRRTPFIDVIDQARRCNEDLCPLECRIRQSQLRYFGHVLRKGRKDSTNEMAYSYIAGNAKQGGQFMDFKDSLKEALRMFDISTTKWETGVKQLSREEWKNLLKIGMEDAVKKWKVKRRQDRETRGEEGEAEAEAEVENQETGELTQAQDRELDLDLDQSMRDVDEFEESFSESEINDMEEDYGVEEIIGTSSKDTEITSPVAVQYQSNEGDNNKKERIGECNISQILRFVDQCAAATDNTDNTFDTEVTSSFDPSTHSAERSGQKGDEEETFDVAQFRRFVDQCATTAGIEWGESGGRTEQMCKSTDDGKEHEGQDENVMDASATIGIKRKRNYSSKRKTSKLNISEEAPSLVSVESTEKMQLMEEEKQPEGHVENRHEEMRESQTNDSTHSEEKKREDSVGGQRNTISTELTRI